MPAIKKIIRKLLPESVLSLYHLGFAKFSAMRYGYPSERMVVIGVTGTNGKSSTTQFIGRLLERAGYKVGWTTTASFKVGEEEWVNDKKMTMLGRSQLQRLLQRMADAGCRYAVIETSSEGIKQHRQVGINYDVAVFTNLTPEHIESHGSFENYKQAKGKLFSAVASAPVKRIDGKAVPKTAIVNVDDEHAPFFLDLGPDKKLGYGFEKTKRDEDSLGDYEGVLARDVELSPGGATFFVGERPFALRPLGRFNVANALAAIATCRALDIPWDQIRAGVASLDPVPGRMEPIDEGQSYYAIVDYAYEPAALGAIYETLDLMEFGKLIHVLGAAGGGRDTAKRPVLGKMAAEKAAIVIVANEDPYDEDPMKIINEVAEGAAKAGKEDGKDLFRILDRQEAIEQAVSLAEKGDLVLVTGKGSEPVMAVENDKKIPWDDRDAVRAAIRRRGGV